MIKVNINDVIKVKLTDLGKEIVQKNFDELRAWYPTIPLQTIYPIDDDGYTEFQLWTFMSMFGEHLYNGAPQIIENNEIIFCED